MIYLRARFIKTSILTLAVSAASALPVLAQKQTGPAAPQDSARTEISGHDVKQSIPQLPKISSTPVDIDREKPEEPSLHYYDKHGNPLEQPVMFLTELDTVTNVRSGPVYPAFNGISVGMNFFDGIMMAVGQQRGSFDISVDCAVHNWIFPVVEAGIGFADAHPDNGRCHYESPPAFYAKAGIDYNFLYKSNPDYKLFFGLRAGFSHFKYDIYSISPGSEYYKDESSPAEMTGLRSTSFYGQILAGLTVRVYKGLAFGWTFRYGFDFKNRFSNGDYPAWFIPGKGTGPVSATFSIIWTLRPKKKE